MQQNPTVRCARKRLREACHSELVVFSLGGCSHIAYPTNGVYENDQTKDCNPQGRDEKITVDQPGKRSA